MTDYETSLLSDMRVSFTQERLPDKVVTYFSSFTFKRPFLCLPRRGRSPFKSSVWNERHWSNRAIKHKRDPGEAFLWARLLFLLFFAMLQWKGRRRRKRQCYRQVVNSDWKCHDHHICFESKKDLKNLCRNGTDKWPILYSYTSILVLVIYIPMSLFLLMRYYLWILASAAAHAQWIPQISVGIWIYIWEKIVYLRVALHLRVIMDLHAYYFSFPCPSLLQHDESMS